MRYLLELEDALWDAPSSEGASFSERYISRTVYSPEEKQKLEEYEEKEARKAQNGFHLVRWKTGPRRFTATLNEVYTVKGLTRIPCKEKTCQRCGTLLLPGMSVTEETWADNKRFYHFYWCFDC